MRYIYCSLFRHENAHPEVSTLWCELDEMRYIYCSEFHPSRLKTRQPCLGRSCGGGKGEGSIPVLGAGVGGSLRGVRASVV